MQSLELDPTKGTCCFGAGLHGWAFTIPYFARMYSRKYGGEMDQWRNNLWGNHFFNKVKNVWSNKSTNSDGTENVRGFALFIMEPILDMFRYVLADDKKKYGKMLTKFDIKLTPDDEAEQGKKLLKAIMMKFLPASNALLEMIINHLPSPVVA